MFKDRNNLGVAEGEYGKLFGLTIGSGLRIPPSRFPRAVQLQLPEKLMRTLMSWIAGPIAPIFLSKRMTSRCLRECSWTRILFDFILYFTCLWGLHVKEGGCHCRLDMGGWLGSCSWIYKKQSSRLTVWKVAPHLFVVLTHFEKTFARPKLTSQTTCQEYFKRLKELDTRMSVA